MRLNADGYLDPGIYPVTVEEVKVNFVDAVPASETRATIFEGFVRHTADLRQRPVAFEQYVDGSFVSSKINPGDIDLVCVADADTLDSLPTSEQEKIRQLFRGKITKSTHHCDAYLIASVSESDPRYQYYFQNKKFWLGCFGFDRADQPKGFLRLQIAPVTQDPSCTGLGGAPEGAVASSASP
jgi:hypothetical protein